MSYENLKLVTNQTVEGPPVVMVHKNRDLSADAINAYANRMSSADPPGVPISSYYSNSFTSDHSISPVSVQLVDENEKILFDVCESLADRLGCPMDRPVKVVAIVGNTGDGKSHTLNHTFFNGKEIFSTSPSQSTCTIGVWAAYAAHLGCILLDTEGMLGTSSNHNQHRRLLLKVFAISDIVIYLTKAPRLHADMFTFLADASDSFAQHFRPDLEALAKKTGLPWTPGQLGPAVIVFQETRHTDPLEESQKANPSPTASDSVSKTLQTRLEGQKRNVDSFSSLHYIGTQTRNCATDFKPLCTLTELILKDTSVRVPRNLEHIFSGLHLLNSRFAYSIPSHSQYTFVEEYFTCPITCDSCSVRCCLSVSHSDPHQAAVPAPDYNGKSKHATATGCKYDPELKNKLYYCKDCYSKGIKTMVVPKAGESLFDAARYFCSGYVLECKRHGVIYQSRSLWSVNPEPEDTPRVHWEVIHVWSGEKTVLQGVHPFSQVLLDSVNAVTKQVSDFASPPVRLLGDLFADTVAPEYWQPNSTIRYCAICKFEFPDPSTDGLDYDSRADSKLSVQPAGEHQHPASGYNSTRKPDERDPAVLLHAMTLNPASVESPASQPRLVAKLSPVTNQLIMDTDKHHCRGCGRGVCGACSTGRLPVPGFGGGPVRVCDQCYSKRSDRPGNTIPIESPHPQVTAPIDSTNQNVYTGRRALELCTATVSSVPPVFSMFKDTLKSLARPAYWTPDELCTICAVCGKLFGPSRRIHHCRACGRGVCEPCSPHRQPVPLRGLDLPHRVCDACVRADV